MTEDSASEMLLESTKKMNITRLRSSGSIYRNTNPKALPWRRQSGQISISDVFFQVNNQQS